MRTGHISTRCWQTRFANRVTTHVHVEGGGWVLRGGCVGGSVLWRRGDTGPAQARALGFRR